MRVVIAGGHGQIALRLARLLSARGDDVVGLIRNPAHAPDVRAAGGSPIVADLETVGAEVFAGHLIGASAVVFAAGAGPGSDTDRKDTVDRAGAALLADASQLTGVDRYLLVSSMGAGNPPPPGTAAVFAAYLRAKTASEEDLRGRPLEWTILRPGVLTDMPGTGRVRLGGRLPWGSVSRDDVAAVLVALLDHRRTARLTLELTAGDTSIADAVGAFLM
jgi:uncharacterized protein YbjT (DUF2867 family)